MREVTALYLTFALADVCRPHQRFALAGAQVAQILPPTALVSVPLAPTAVCGILNLRGRLVTVVDPAPLLGQPAQAHTLATAGAHILILEPGGADRRSSLGLWVAQLLGTQAALPESPGPLQIINLEAMMQQLGRLFTRPHAQGAT